MKALVFLLYSSHPGVFSIIFSVIGIPETKRIIPVMTSGPMTPTHPHGDATAMMNMPHHIVDSPK